MRSELNKSKNRRSARSTAGAGRPKRCRGGGRPRIRKMRRAGTRNRACRKLCGFGRIRDGGARRGTTAKGPTRPVMLWASGPNRVPEGGILGHAGIATVAGEPAMCVRQSRGNRICADGNRFPGCTTEAFVWRTSVVGVVEIASDAAIPCEVRKQTTVFDLVADPGGDDCRVNLERICQIDHGRRSRVELHAAFLPYVAWHTRFLRPLICLVLKCVPDCRLHAQFAARALVQWVRPRIVYTIQFQGRGRIGRTSCRTHGPQQSRRARLPTLPPPDIGLHTKYNPENPNGTCGWLRIADCMIQCVDSAPCLDSLPHILMEFLSGFLHSRKRFH